MATIGVRPLHYMDTIDLQMACWPSLSVEQVHQRVAQGLALARRGRVWPMVGLYNGAAVGFGQLARWRDLVEIADLVVGERWQSRGVGTAIVSCLMQLARQQGFNHVEIGVAKSNVRAHTLYRRLGFDQIESRALLDLGHGPEPILYLSCALREYHD